MNKLKQILVLSLYVGFMVNSLFIFRVFMEIAIFGQITAIEPTRWILWIELIISFIIFVGSIVILVKVAMRYKYPDKYIDDYLSTSESIKSGSEPGLPT